MKRLEIFPSAAIAASTCGSRVFHNISGPEGTWTGGREKAPAALCRKIAEQPEGGKVELREMAGRPAPFIYRD